MLIINEEYLTLEICYIKENWNHLYQLIVLYIIFT